MRYYGSCVPTLPSHAYIVVLTQANRTWDPNVWKDWCYQWPPTNKWDEYPPNFNFNRTEDYRLPGQKHARDCDISPYQLRFFYYFWGKDLFPSLPVYSCARYKWRREVYRNTPVGNRVAIHQPLLWGLIGQRNTFWYSCALARRYLNRQFRWRTRDLQRSKKTKYLVGG